MRATAGMLLVGLLAVASGGCTSTRSSLAKSDSPKPSAKTDDEVRVKYGFPWGDSPKKSSAKGEALSNDLGAKLAEAREKSARKGDVAELLQKAAEAERLGDAPADLQAAKLSYQKVLEADPRNAEAHHRLAVIADKRQDFRAADQHYSHALAANRKDADLLMDVGYSHFLRGNLAESELFLKEALEVNPYNQLASEHLGQLYARQGKYDAALAMFRQSATESEAQRLLAQAFPNGRPNPNGTLGMPLANDRRVAPANSTNADFALTGQNFDPSQQRMMQERLANQRPRDQRFDGDMRPQFSQFADPQRQSSQNASAAPAATQTGQPANTWPQIAGTLYPSITPGNAAAPLAQPSNAQTAPTAVSPATQSSTSLPLSNSGTFTVPPSWGNGSDTNPAPVASANATTPPAMSQSPNGSTFWQGGPPATNQASSAATPYDTARVPTTPSNLSPFPQTNPAWNNGTSPPPDLQPAGYETRTPLNQPPWQSGPPTTAAPNADAARWAAQMAMGSGPGAMFPVVSSGPSNSPIMQTNATGPMSNEVRWAYGEVPANAPAGNPVENAVWSSDRNAPGNEVRPAGWNGNVAPASPWNNWQSPAPPSTNWMTPADNAPSPVNSQPTQQYPTGAAMANPNGGYNTMPPQWPSGPPTMQRPAPSADPLGAYEMELRNAPANAPTTSHGFGQPPMNSSLPAPTTISNWPYAPSR